MVEGLEQNVNTLATELLFNKDLFWFSALLICTCIYSNASCDLLDFKTSLNPKKYNIFITSFNILILYLKYMLSNNKINFFITKFIELVNNNSFQLIILVIMSAIATMPFGVYIFNNFNKLSIKNVFAFLITNTLPNFAGVFIFIVIFKSYSNVNEELLINVLYKWGEYICTVLIPFAIMFSILYSFSYIVNEDLNIENWINSFFLFLIFFISGVLLFVIIIYFMWNNSFYLAKQFYIELTTAIIIYYIIYGFDLLLKNKNELIIYKCISCAIYLLNILMFTLSVFFKYKGTIDTIFLFYPLLTSGTVGLICYIISCYKENKCTKPVCLVFPLLDKFCNIVSVSEINKNTDSKINKRLGRLFIETCICGIVFALLFLFLIN